MLLNKNPDTPRSAGAGEKTCGDLIRTAASAMPFDVLHDKRGTFVPQLIRKYARRLPGFDDKVIHLFAHGMTIRPMQRMLRELYDIDVSP